MAYEEYAELSEKIVSLPYTQRLDLLSRLADSLAERDCAPEGVTVNSKEDLHNKLKEGADDLDSGRTMSADAAKSLFRAKHGL